MLRHNMNFHGTYDLQLANFYQERVGNSTNRRCHTTNSWDVRAYIVVADVDAKILFGTFYRDASCVHRDGKKAVQLYLKELEVGDSDASRRVGEKKEEHVVALQYVLCVR